jgi:hypothetical protein
MGERVSKHGGKLPLNTAAYKFLYVTFCITLVQNHVCQSQNIEQEEGRNKRGLEVNFG